MDTGLPSPLLSSNSSAQRHSFHVAKETAAKRLPHKPVTRPPRRRSEKPLYIPTSRLKQEWFRPAGDLGNHNQIASVPRERAQSVALMLDTATHRILSFNRRRPINLN